MKKPVLFIVIVLMALLSKAQYFETGQDPASLKWRQINTKNFQLIYPDYYELQAQVLAQKLEKAYDYGSRSLNHKPQKISVILHTQTVRSNGLVAYAPRRSEFYTTPHQGIYPQDWLEQLAIHEFRHVVQIDKINSELPKIIKLLLGEQGTALVFGAYLPWWYIEGDAVVAETAMSRFGRGRFPSFLMEHRAQVVEKGVYSYDKAYNGSYKDYVPNHYMLGYHLVANTNARYGNGTWKAVLHRVGTKPFSLNPFNKALKSETGMNKVQLYLSVFDSLAVEWKKVDEKYVLPHARVVSPEKKSYTDYRYNHWLDTATVVSYRTALNKIPAFVQIDKEGNEKVLHRPGHIFDESVNYRNEWIVWSEQLPDLRWSHSGRSEIWLLNIKNGKKIKLEPEFKALAPSVSPDLNSIAVVESDFSSNHYLSVYRISDGALQHRIQTENNNYLFSPEWIGNNEIVAVILTPDGKRLARFNLRTGDQEILLDQDLGELKHLKVHGNDLYFISSYSGENSLYSLDLDDRSVQQVFKPRFGVESPAVRADGKVLLSDYTADGFRLISTDGQNSTALEKVQKAEYLLAKTLAQQEPGIIDFAMDDTVAAESHEYKKPAHLFNFHSWAPVFINVADYDVMPGVSVMSQNKLGTAQSTLGYRWDTSEKTGKFYGSYIYKGWYPELSIKATTGKRAAEYLHITESGNHGSVTRDTTSKRLTWNETTLEAGMTLPLNLTRGTFSRFFQPEINYAFTRYKKDDSTPEGFIERDLQSLAYRLYYHQLLRRSYQDVYPDFGFILEASFRHSPIGTEDLGHILAGQTVWYLPGILRNHGIKVYGGAQTKGKGDNFGFSDVVRYPRGWGRIATNELYSLAFDYKMPLLNPDWSLMGLVYIRRVTASVFADHARLFGNVYSNGKISGTFETGISSYGIELTGDVNFLRFYAPVEIGFRTSYLPEADDFVVDFLLSVNFTSL